MPTAENETGIRYIWQRADNPAVTIGDGTREHYTAKEALDFVTLHLPGGVTKINDTGTQITFTHPEREIITYDAVVGSGVTLLDPVAPKGGLEWHTARELTRVANRTAQALRRAADEIESAAAKASKVGTRDITSNTAYSTITADAVQFILDAVGSATISQLIQAGADADVARAERLAGGSD